MVLNRWRRFALIYANDHRLKHEFFAVANIVVPVELSDLASNVGGQLNYRQGLARSAKDRFASCCPDLDAADRGHIDAMRRRMRRFIERKWIASLAQFIADSSLAEYLATEWMSYCLGHRSELPDCTELLPSDTCVATLMNACVPWLYSEYESQLQRQAEEQATFERKLKIYRGDKELVDSALSEHFVSLVANNPERLVAIAHLRAQELETRLVYANTLSDARLMHDDATLASLEKAKKLHEQALEKLDLNAASDLLKNG